MVTSGVQGPVAYPPVISWTRLLHEHLGSLFELRASLRKKAKRSFHAPFNISRAVSAERKHQYSTTVTKLRQLGAILLRARLGSSVHALISCVLPFFSVPRPYLG